MIRLVRRYTQWLHTRWPAGTVEKLPEVREDGSTNVPGLYVVGDLTGIPLLKFSADSGARAVRTIVADAGFQAEAKEREPGVKDLVIVGGGVSGMAAALEAKKAGLEFELLEASEPFATIVNFPKAKPIFTYPTDMTPAGELQFRATVKEPLIAELHAQTLERGVRPRIAHVEGIEREGGKLAVRLDGGEKLFARRVVVAIGRSGNFRKLGVPGEDSGKVFNRLHDPKEFSGKPVLVVGGGDSALETAIALAQCGAAVTLSYRRPEFARPKPENVERLEALRADPMANVAVESPSSERVNAAVGEFMEGHRKPGSIRLTLGSAVKRIDPESVAIVDAQKQEHVLPNAVVFTMIGREAPLDFFRKSGVRIAGELQPRDWTLLALFFAFCAFLYNWKAGGALKHAFEARDWFPFGQPTSLAEAAERGVDPATLAGTLAITLSEPGFYYSLAYCALVTVFGIARIRKRRTPYVKVQTLTLMAIQLVPLFLLPYVVLPWLGHNGAFDAGFGKTLADNLFPAAGYGHGREYWRAFGFVLAWPLFIWNVFTEQPLWWWLAISLVQTAIVIPLLVRKWGKGAYCGWICSCGALAETLGDAHRTKMPHGRFWNRLNMVGQVVLAVAVVLFLVRVTSWTLPGTWIGEHAKSVYYGLLSGWSVLGIQLNYYWLVDVGLAGIFGVAFYFWFSGRIWCRFACPLAALMHIYARFSRFRILPEKKKCISCNVCTSVCHQGIDVMNFANKGLPMADPECVRCSACVQMCPTGVLEFGEVDPKSGSILRRDSLAASATRLAER
ncbi:MAG: NAD(P)-binding domain-containing protein, partial [Planctomycetes bacterium]|nr:NAD(P)-binding domain-containing protein [Planctomycetota bacterium]